MMLEALHFEEVNPSLQTLLDARGEPSSELDYFQFSFSFIILWLNCCFSIAKSAQMQSIKAVAF